MSQKPPPGKWDKKWQDQRASAILSHQVDKKDTKGAALGSNARSREKRMVLQEGAKPPGRG